MLINAINRLDRVFRTAKTYVDTLLSLSRGEKLLPLKCPDCGGSDLEVAAWVGISDGLVDLNGPITPTFVGDISGCWCRTCREHVPAEWTEGV